MIRSGKKISLNTNELDCLSAFAGEQVNPKTVDDYNAWWDHVKETTTPTSPEERLIVAMADFMKVDTKLHQP